MIGQTISHYKILEKLGEGGMGVVYKAQDTKLDRFVALKFLPADLIRDEEAKTRFIHEAKAASALNHPNICNIHEIDETPDGQIFIVMAAYEGTSLNKKIKNSPLKIEEALNIAIQTAEGLQAAHKKGIVHRDIKSSNVMITEEDRAMIMDFGLAKTTAATMLTKSGATIGTVPYMSPEQARGEKVDHRTDIWSLGVVMYETIAGKLPFASEYSDAVVYSILNVEPKPLTSLRSDVPMELERIVKKCLEKDRNNRYQHADELIVDLRQVKAGVGKEASRESVPKPTRFQWRNWYLIGGAALLVGLLLFIFLPRFTSRDEVIHSIAVLPLENLSRDPEQEYFADGMTEALITDLAKISSLRVISRTSVMRYKTTQKSVPEIAKELNVDAVVEGSVQRSGDRVRITAQLLHAPTDRHLWAESYERNMTDVLALQSEVALAIAKEIHAKVAPEEETHLINARPVNKEAYELYLKGHYYWNKRDLKKALEYFEKAIATDSTYGLAYVGVAEVYSRFGYYKIGSMPPKQSFPRAKQALIKALQIDETNAEAHSILAFVRLFYDWDWLAAEKECKRAIELNPSNAEAHHTYSHYLIPMNRFEESLTECKRALELDPLSLIINAHLGEHYRFARESEQAITQEQKALELDQNFFLGHRFLGECYLDIGKYPEAISEIQKAISLSGESAPLLAVLGRAYALAENRTQALKILDELRVRSQKEYVPAESFAEIYLGLGDKDRAFEWLQKAYDERSSILVYLNAEPMFDNVRGDPRFSELLKKIGLKPSESDKGRSLPSVEKSKAESSPTWQNSIAVLPFKNISADKEQEYFCDGMTEQLITNLTNLPNVKVIARTSVMQFKNSDKTIQQIANELDVAHVLEGSVRKSGNKIRVTAQLIKADDGFHLWAKDYDRQLKDIFAVQDDVSKAITEALRINLTAKQSAAIAKHYTENSEAYDLYLKGRHYWGRWALEGFKKALDYFQQAIKKDPTFALPHSGLATAYSGLSVFGFLPPREAMPKAEAEATKAMELDISLSDAYVSLAVVKAQYHYDLPSAEKNLRRAIELNPSHSLARCMHCIWARWQGSMRLWNN